MNAETVVCLLACLLACLFVRSFVRSVLALMVDPDLHRCHGCSGFWEKNGNFSGGSFWSAMPGWCHPRSSNRETDTHDSLDTERPVYRGLPGSTGVSMLTYIPTYSALLCIHSLEFQREKNRTSNVAPFHILSTHTHVYKL